MAPNLMEKNICGILMEDKDPKQALKLLLSKLVTYYELPYELTARNKFEPKKDI